MDLLSFASAYRTAAILAAFSQASSGAEAPRRGHASLAQAAGLSGVAAARRSLSRFLARLRPAAGARPSRIGRALPDGSAPVPSGHEGAPPSRLVSHFAFCDGAAAPTERWSG